MVGTPYPFETLPRPLDVVWSQFPYDEARGVPAIEPHPALVFETNEYRPGEYAVKVAYGTSNVTRADRAQHFVVSNWNAMQFAGLNRETFFDLGRFKWLPWTDAWFTSPDPQKYATPVIGRIVDDGIASLRYVLEQRRAAGLITP
jgi:hypothetical protein